MTHRTGCMVCGADIVYFDEPREMECVFCHGTFSVTSACSAGHYVCDGCHAKQAISTIVEACGDTRSSDPIEIMVSIMREPVIHMHGPEHHVLVGAALIAAYRNSGGEVDLDAALSEIVRRGSQIPGGSCGFWGCCGAAVSAGMFISIVTGSTPLSHDEWGLSNLMTSMALERIGECGGPRCCKRDSFLSAQVAVDFVEEHLGIRMTRHEGMECEFTSLNAQCIGRRCPFHPAGSVSNMK